MLTFEDFVEQSQQAATVPHLRALFEHVMADEGFENHFVGTVVGRVATRIGWAEFPRGHFETYLAERWYDTDPIMTHMLRANRPFSWDDTIPGRQFSKPQVALLDECKRVGVHSIIIVPFQQQDGGCDVVSISKRHAEPPDPRRIPILQAICTQTWCRYADLAGSSLTDGTAMLALTDRELEILKWIKHGKSNTEISEITALSVKTIEYHVGKILKKLGASNRTTAVVIALKNGQLSL